MQHCPAASAHRGSPRHGLLKYQLKHTSRPRSEYLQSSTSPHCSIWLFTSACAACAASSAVIRLLTSASAMRKDFDVYVALSMAAYVSARRKSLKRRTSLPAISQLSNPDKSSSSFSYVSTGCGSSKNESVVLASMSKVDWAQSRIGRQCWSCNFARAAGSFWWKLVNVQYSPRRRR